MAPRTHKLHAILTMVLCAVLRDMADRVGMEALVEEQETGLRNFPELPNRISSHDTLSDV
ncbi:MAG: transposase family protein [Candidatus Contendobacter sp.]|nr:transposase family protein [Candidatus Contendobacter sp.]MDG4557881.1 transposase family protein [Candidatus Contendobacter sp.]